MNETGFWWILFAIALYGALHSFLAANQVKRAVAQGIGQPAYDRFYRLFFSIVGAVTFLPVLALGASLPDQAIYTITSPWNFLARGGQLLALIGLAMGVLQTSALSFIGLRQVFDGSDAAPDKLIVNGLYRWVRHPLYTCTLLFLWLNPVMTWNVLALNLGVTLYMWIGSIFEERKLVDQFGEAYVEYRKKTPRIVPGLMV